MRTTIVAAILSCLALQSLQFTLAFVPSTANTFGTTSTRLFSAPKPLATEGDWIAYLDEDTTGVIYYFNSRTGESLWEPPPNFPAVYLKPSQRRKAEAQKEEYFKSTQQQQQQEQSESGGEKKQGFMSKLFTDTKEEETVEEIPKEDEKSSQETEKEGGGFFSRLMQPPPQSTESAPVAEEAAATPVPSQAPVELKKEAEAASKKGFLDNIFGSMTADSATTAATVGGAATKEPEPFFTQEGESDAGKAVREAEEDKIAAEQKVAAANTAAEQQQAREDAAAAQKAAAAAEQQAREEAKLQAAEERKMMEEVRKAEMAQKAEAKKMEVEARKLIEENKRAEKAAAVEAKKEAAAAKKAEVEEAKLATIEAKRVAAEEKIMVAETQAPIKVEIGSCVLPHPSKVRWGGEDAVFTKGNTFGVFDGVSGADKLDGLPLYSKMLAKQMTQLVGTGNELTIKDMQDFLLTAAETADEQATGASTAVVASITQDGFLRAINLGDSACIVVRGDKVVAKTKEIVHYFDCPYQLSDISPDRPRDARKLNFELVRGDIIFMASDGIFDNLADAEIAELVNSAPAAKIIAKKVSERSRKVSLDSQAETPYSIQARRNGDPDFRDGLGGKVDDVSCVVVRYV